MKKFITINEIPMVQCGDYNWEILKENDGSDVYKMHLRSEENQDIILLYGEGNFTIRNSSTFYGSRDGDFFIFKMEFDKTPFFVNALIEGEGLKISPIYHKNTVKISKFI